MERRCDEAGEIPLVAERKEKGKASGKRKATQSLQRCEGGCCLPR